MQHFDTWFSKDFCPPTTNTHPRTLQESFQPPYLFSPHICSLQSSTVRHGVTSTCALGFLALHTVAVVKNDAPAPAALIVSDYGVTTSVQTAGPRCAASASGAALSTGMTVISPLPLPASSRPEFRRLRVRRKEFVSKLLTADKADQSRIFAQPGFHLRKFHICL